MDWKKLHKAIERRSKAQTTARAFTGVNFNFWAQFARENIDKLDLLNECILLDMRQKGDMSYENEIYARQALEGLVEVIKLCNTELKESEIKEKELQNEQEKKKDLKKYL
jgi:hypothetical protein